MISINWKPEDRQLRQFGLIALFALPIIGWIFTSETRIFGWIFSDASLVWHSGNLTVIGILAAIGAVCGVLALVRPQLLKPIFLLLSLITIPIGLVVGEVVLGLTYFLLFVPIGLFFRLIGRDSLERKLAPEAETYWKPKKKISDPARYFRQY